MEDILVPIALFAIIPLIVWAVSHYRYKARARAADVVKTMIGKDVKVTPEIIKSVGFVPKRTHGDLRTGMIMIAIGLAFILLGNTIPDDEAPQIMQGVAMFPILIGVALLIFWYAVSRKDEA